MSIQPEPTQGGNPVKLKYILSFIAGSHSIVSVRKYLPQGFKREICQIGIYNEVDGLDPVLRVFELQTLYLLHNAFLVLNTSHGNLYLQNLLKVDFNNGKNVL